MIAIAIVLIILACILNGQADAQHRRNAATIRANGSDKSPIVQAGHAANGCTGVLMWLAIAAAIVAVMGGFAVGGTP